MRRDLLSAIFMLALVFAVNGLVGCSRTDDESLVIGSKSFTESAILGDMLGLLAEQSGSEVTRRSFPGSSVAFNALLAGEIDLYPEYTGTLKRELLAALEIESDEELVTALEERGLALSEPLGFNNTYAIGVTRETAERLELSTVSQLAEHPDLRLAFSTEFMNRGDGWPSLRQTYALPGNARGIEHSLAYGALASGSIDATDLYSTDAQIAAMDLVVLEDDRRHFPRYDAVILYRRSLRESHSGALAAMLRLEGRIDETRMRQLNALAEIGEEGSGRITPAEAAARGIRDLYGMELVVESSSLPERVAARTREHLTLVGISMTVAIAAAIPLGVLAARRRWASGPVLATTGVLQTIPAIALLVLLIRPFGIGAQTAIVALVLYSLLPIVRNTHAALTGIPGDLLESADAIGLSAIERLWAVEIPLALPTILAGVKTAAVINVGTATLGGFISAGGYGQPIFTGITQNNFDKILEGAVPAALLAIVVQLTFDALEGLVVPRGLRL